MTRILQTFEDGSTVAFDRGSFDDWCVYLHRPPARRYAPTDEHYFTRLQALGNEYGHQTLYDDFLKVYAQTTAQPDPDVLVLILRESPKYADHALEIAIWLTVIYAGMIAEENKTGAILKKRIKRLGMHQALIEHLPPTVAATFSKAKKWRNSTPFAGKKDFSAGPGFCFVGSPGLFGRLNPTFCAVTKFFREKPKKLPLPLPFNALRR